MVGHASRQREGQSRSGGGGHSPDPGGRGPGDGSVVDDDALRQPRRGHRSLRRELGPHVDRGSAGPAAVRFRRRSDAARCRRLPAVAHHPGAPLPHLSRLHEQPRLAGRPQGDGAQGDRPRARRLQRHPSLRVALPLPALFRVWAPLSGDAADQERGGGDLRMRRFRGGARPLRGGARLPAGAGRPAGAPPRPGLGPQAQGVLRRGLHRVRAVSQTRPAAGAVVPQVRLPAPRRAVAPAAGNVGPGGGLSVVQPGAVQGGLLPLPGLPGGHGAAGPSSSTSTTTGAGVSGPPRRWPITARPSPFTPGLRAWIRRRAATSRRRTTTGPSSAASASCSNTRNCCIRRSRGRRSPSSTREGRRCRRRWTASTPSSGSDSTWRTATGSSTSSSTSSCWSAPATTRPSCCRKCRG